MRFYNFMTLVWVSIWAPGTGAFVYLMTQDQGGTQAEAVVLGGIATVGMAVAIYFWRLFKDAG